jgi:class I fructose-bisphosphate aldolase
MSSKTLSLLGSEGEALLKYTCKGVSNKDLHAPGPDFIDRVTAMSDRSNGVLVNLQRLYNHGRLKGTGYLSMFPVDQGIEHSAAASDLF